MRPQPGHGDIVRLILDGTVIKTRIDGKATNVSVLAAVGVRWGEDLTIQRCTVHRHRNLLGHAPKRLHDEIGNDYRDMIYAETVEEIQRRRRAFLKKWRNRYRAVADSLEEAGDRLFTFTRLDPSQWRPARTTNAIERLNGEFRRRRRTRTLLPCAEMVPMPLWALLAPGRIRMRKVDGWQTLSLPTGPSPLPSPPDRRKPCSPGDRIVFEFPPNSRHDLKERRAIVLSEKAAACLRFLRMQ